ncbi:hypothetical protein IWW47_003587, partial [Coemansia sp. RSA 2052]
MTNLKSSLISLFFAVGLASATNAASNRQPEAASVAAQQIPSFVSQVPSFASPTKNINHAAVSVAPMPHAFVTPTQFINTFAHAMPTLAAATGKPQQPKTGSVPAAAAAKATQRAPVTAAKPAQRAPAAHPAGIATRPDGKKL